MFLSDILWSGQTDEVDSLLGFGQRHFNTIPVTMPEWLETHREMKPVKLYVDIYMVWRFKWMQTIVFFIAALLFSNKLGKQQFPLTNSS